jgi:hypothetical protein
MLPEKVTVNAWFGREVSSEYPLGIGAEDWLRQVKVLPPRLPLFAEPHADWKQWSDPRVGWSLLLSHRDDLSASQLSEPDPEPEFEPIRQLWQVRGCPPIYRYDRGNPDYLRRHARQGPVAQQDLDNARTGYGTGVDQVPFYLLICGSPRVVPWEIQFRLNLSRAVGRLDLPKEGLVHYVTSLLSDWKESAANPLNTVVWATSADWVTKVMKAAIAEPLFNAFEADNNLRQGAQSLFGHEATAHALRTSLGRQRPGLIVTTSHGCMDSTRPGLAERLGVPVDALHDLMTPVPLLDEWQPGGAIWLGVACCSAGIHSQNSFHGLLSPRSAEHDTMERIANELGPAVAPLPRALLGAPNPLRAFIGHVEPTFDRTWYDEANHQRLADALLQAFYQHLYQPQSEPIGWGLRGHFLQYGALRDAVDAGREATNRFDPDGPRQVLDSILRALDVRNLVILGDPTVALDFNRCSLASTNGLPPSGTSLTAT